MYAIRSYYGIILKNKKMSCYFISDQQSPFYQSEVFTRVLSYVQHNPNKCRMKEKNNKLSISFEKVISVVKSKEILGEI